MPTGRGSCPDRLALRERVPVRAGEGSGPTRLARMKQPCGDQRAGCTDLARTLTSIGALQYAVLTTKLIETWPITVIGTFSHAGALAAASRMILPFVSLGPSRVLLR